MTNFNTQRGKGAATLIIGILVVGAIAFGAWYLIDNQKDGQAADDAAMVASEGGLVAGETIAEGSTSAIVNGQQVDQQRIDDLIEFITHDAEHQGADTKDQTIINSIRDQALQTLINTELLIQAAIAGNFSPSAEEIDEQYNTVVESSGGAEVFEQQLADNGASMEEFKEDLARDLAINKLLESTINRDAIVVTDEEIQAEYDAAIAINPDLPPLEEIRDQAENEIRARKEQEMVSDYIQGLRDAATIELE